MKDFKRALEDRLATIEKKMDFEKQRHDAAIEKLTTDRHTVLAMIAIETDSAEQQEDMFAPKAGPVREVTGKDLENGIIGLLKNQNNWSHAALKEFLSRKGLGSVDDPQFGRRVQGTLLSLRHRGLVEQPAPSTWSIASQKAESA